MLNTREERVFDALADSTRRKLLTNLAEGHPKTATQLAQEFPISRQAILKQLELLAEAGLVQSSKQGREKHYAFAPEPLDDVTEWIAAIGARWETRLQRLKALVEAENNLSQE